MLLSQKVAVIYGASGAIGSSIAHAFSRHGAHVFLTGRHLAQLQATAGEIAAAGGSAEAAQVDALDEGAIDQHLESVVKKMGRIDISFNAIGITDANLGVPLVDLPAQAFAPILVQYTQSYFLTARLAARRMVPQRSGVIMTVSAPPARIGSFNLGGYSAAMAAKEAMTRALSCELAPHGVRAVCLRPHAMPETPTMREVYRRKFAERMTWDQWHDAMASRTHPRRLTTVAELTNAAVFAASDAASGLTGTTLNLSLGQIDD